MLETVSNAEVCVRVNMNPDSYGRRRIEGGREEEGGKVVVVAIALALAAVVYPKVWIGLGTLNNSATRPLIRGNALPLGLSSHHPQPNRPSRVSRRHSRLPLHRHPHNRMNCSGGGYNLDGSF